MAYYSNSCEGEILENQCSECILVDKICPIVMAQYHFNYDQIGNELARKILNSIVSQERGCELFSENKEIMTGKQGMFDCDTCKNWNDGCVDGNFKSQLKAKLGTCPLKINKI